MPRSSMVFALLALALTASLAQAQIPNLRRKAKEAARQATGQQEQQHRPPPKFDNTILELNPQAVTRLITGLEARSRTAGAGGLTAADLRKRSSAASDEAMNINNQHSDDREKWVSANETAENCVTEELSHADERHSQELQQRAVGMAGNPRLMQEWATTTQEAQQAAAANDTVAMKRARDKMNKLMGVDAHADTAKARATCHVPAMPSWMRRADSLAALGDTLAVRARGVEVTGNGAAARAAGMTPNQFAMAAERAEGFVLREESGNVGSGYVFTPNEEQALRARLPELKKYLG